MVTQLPQEFFEFLTDFQRRLCQVIRSVGKIEHDQWRSFCNERKTEFIQLPADTLAEVIELNLEWLDEIEKNYWGNFKRLDEYETQNKNKSHFINFAKFGI